MKRLKVLLLIISLITIQLCGCSNKDKQEETVVISAGDAGVNNDASNVMNNTTEDTVEETNDTDETEVEQTEKLETTNESMLGTWKAKDGTIFSFNKTGDKIKFSGYIVKEKVDVSGTVDTDENTYINIKYTLYIEPDETSEENDNSIEIKEVEEKYKINSIESKDYKDVLGDSKHDIIMTLTDESGNTKEFYKHSNQQVVKTVTEEEENTGEEALTPEEEQEFLQNLDQATETQEATEE